MTTTGDTRARILSAATELFRRQGYAATGMKQIVATARAPYGSAYHFFPGGKAQLGEEVLRSSGAVYLALIGDLFGLGDGPGGDTGGDPGGDPGDGPGDAPGGVPAADRAADPVRATREAFTGAAATLEALDFADPCPVATVALEVASTHEGLRLATSEIFTSWVDALAGYYAAHGITAAPRETAQSVIALLEGAFMLGRAHRSPEPVLAAAAAAAAIVSAALAAPGL
ncbi:TetR family transcriptional regulator [Streptomyces sp. NPDC059443]|uniref:TetR/AcrR family transcriptional regulator n=1 Tax=unclassified Streptomyces TaxID=2593676 RepID=UPI003699B2EA